jgi:tricorn protease
VVFVSDDDLWRASVHGGVAQRLTAGLSEPATPCLSPCGQWLAYTGRDALHTEVWCMPAAGGPARRLTWLGSDLAVRGFAPDGRIVFCSNHGPAVLSQLHGYTLDPHGPALPERLPLGQMDHLAYGPAGRRVIGRNTGDPARWKRYRGGTCRPLWMEERQQWQLHAHEQLQGNITTPMWLGERLYFPERL